MSRLTDLCEYCEKEIEYKKKISKFLTEDNYAPQDSFDLQNLMSHFQIQALNLQRELESSINVTLEIRENLNNRIETLKTFIIDLQDYEVV